MLVCRVLGPLEVTVGETKVDPGGMLPRRLLTALVAAGGQAVPDDRLIELVWGRDRPPTAAAALQVYVSRLRGTLGPEHRGSLERDAGGYRLRTDSVDTTWFAEAVDAGRRLLADGQAETAADKLVEALALWRGEPYADLESAPRARLVELREVAVEELAAARLAGGDAAAAVADLEELVHAAPLRERRWALLVRALYRSGRQGDALAAIRRARAVLADELGVDPGPELRDLERRILHQDPELIGSRQRIRRPLTSFVGRTAELVTMRERLAARRLVSLVGPAGVGKTRLAVEYAADRADPDGPWLARLADVRRDAEVASVVADAVGLVAVSDDPVAAVIRVIGDRSGLLVLDNCEHVVPAAAKLVDALTAGCPQLRILTTSREPLGVDGEITVPVKPLPLATDAVVLLVDRVQAVRPGWSPSSEELADAHRVSAAVDGLPLAIELAAARARVLGLGEIAERLDDRFALLGPVPRGSVATHATLEAAIGWSVDLLSDDDRRLLLRLWPFEGGFTLAAAEAVHPGGDTAVLESLSSLVIRSVVAADTTVTPTRYLMLESIRAYCRSLDPDPDATGEAHARWVRGLAAACFVAIRKEFGGRYLRSLSAELPNIRAGIAHDLEHHPVVALQSAGRLGLFFTRGVQHAESLRLIREVLRAAPDGPALDRARIMIVFVALTYFAGAFDESRQMLAAVPAVVADIGEDTDPAERGELYFHLAFGGAEDGFPEIAIEAADKAIAIGRKHGMRWLVNSASIVRGAAVALRAHLAGDGAATVEAARAAQLITRGWTAGWSHSLLAEACLRHPASATADEALAAARLAAGRFRQEEDVPYGLGALQLGALALARAGRPSEGARLLAAVKQHAVRLGVLVPMFFEQRTDWIDEAMPEQVESVDLTLPEMYDLLAAGSL